jgi:gliding motility-associated-like protein
MKKYFFLLLALPMLLLTNRAQASHIAGAELVYSCTGNNLYHIKLKLYRDCLNGTAPFDDPLILYIFRGDGTVFNTYEILEPPSTPQILPENWNACVGTPYDICVEVGTYEQNVFLPPFSSGYDIAWTRCCRNNVITNLANPECQGITFLAHVPGPAAATCNSMPTFNNTPSIFLCANETYYFDYSATDIDGDSLVYSLSQPFNSTNFQGLGTGAQSSGNCSSSLPPILSNNTPVNIMGPPPYIGVTYSPGYSSQNPFGPGGLANINPATGYLEAFPANMGIFVVAISVKEYRNGVFLSENKRDFQFHVIACLPQGPAPVLTHNLGGLNVVNDTIYVEAGQSFCYTFNVSDALSPSNIVVTPLSVSFGGNGGFPPPYATITTSGNTPPVTGTICWSPSCTYAGNLVPMIISARDVNDCPNYNIVFDTVWVRILPPIVAPPVVTASIGSLPANGDTIVLDVQQSFCFDFMVIDTLGGGSLVGQGLLQDTLGNMLGQVQSVTTTISGDTLFGTVCWETFCNYGRLYMFVLQGTDIARCPPNNVNRDTIWLRVNFPYNPPPLLTSDIFQNPTNGDTILANVNEAFCFQFSVLDTTTGLGEAVSFDVTILDQFGGVILDNPVTYSVFGSTDSIAGEICWTPQCPSVDQLITIIVRGDQENACNLHNYDYDTIYVRVDEPIKPVPLISHDLGPNFPGNTEIEVADDTEFCFEFELRDTVMPTKVNYSVKVLYANGVEYTGATPPVITYTNNDDSLLRGTICWSVPCELSNQQFSIVMTGRDSFDCRVSNTVYDTVLVRHTENPPSVLQFCNASVDNTDSSITLKWTAQVESDVVGFVVYRRVDSDSSYVVLDSIFNVADTQYVDYSVLPDDHSYCYRLTVIDRCGTPSIFSEAICTILFHADPVEYSASMTWTPFVGWGSGPIGYDIWRSSPTLVDGYPATYLTSKDTQTFSYVDTEVDNARLCYRIRAIADGTGCAEYSQSNENCVNFPPTLYVPSGFTPNGDGLNDYFSSFGEFVQSFHMEIFDRWGKLVFVSDDVRTGWDGSADKVPAAEGVYVFKIKVVGYDGEELEKNGSVTLVR